jgi:hypothetical protein
MKLISFRNLRILVLLVLLVGIAFYTQGQRLSTQGWYKPLPVAIFPVNEDSTPTTSRYIARLNESDFRSIDEFMARESAKYDVVISRPTDTRLNSEVRSRPPEPPTFASNTLRIMLWSLKLRWWAYRNTPEELADKDCVRIFVLYQQGQEGVSLRHSLGLQKGLIGVVHAYARTEQNAQNNIVIAHELMHTVGATDKYSDHGDPVFPEGFAEPNREPLYPQCRAEIMAGRIPLSQYRWKMADSLRTVIVGTQTAREIHWIEKES